MTEPDNSSSESENDSHKTNKYRTTKQCFDSDDTDSSEENDICGTISSAT